MGLLDADGQTFIWAGGGTEDGFVDTCWSYDRSTGGWTSLPPLPFPLLRSAAVRHENLVHMVAGTTSGRIEVDSLLQLDLHTGEWTTLKSAGGPGPRFKHRAVGVEREMVVIGGKNDDADPAEIYGDVWRYDVDAHKWTEQSSSNGPSGIYRHAMAYDAARGQIWVQGGFDAEEHRSDWLWSIDTESWTWTQYSWDGAGPPVRASHALAVTDEGLWVWGGNSTDTSVWLFHPETSVWEEWDLHPAPIARDAFVYDLSPDQSQLWILGGDPVEESVPDFVADLWLLDLETMQWNEVEDIGQD